jgi:hypothetical protein
MSEEAAQAAALQAYADAVREYNEQQQLGDDNLSSVAAAAAASLPFNFAVDDEEVQYLMSMEEKASMMLMERLSNDLSHAVSNNDNNSNNDPQQMNEILLQELIGLAGGQQGTDDAMAQHLLSILEQQKHQNIAYEDPPEQTIIPNRPEKHFFTVAQDGMYFFNENYW